MKLKLTNYSPAPFLFDSNQFSWNTHTGSYHPRRRNTGFEFNRSTLANYRSRLRAQIKKKTHTHTHGKFKNRLILDRTKKRSICYKKLENKFILSKVFFSSTNGARHWTIIVFYEVFWDFLHWGNTNVK